LTLQKIHPGLPLIWNVQIVPGLDAKQDKGAFIKNTDIGIRLMIHRYRVRENLEKRFSLVFEMAKGCTASIYLYKPSGNQRITKWH